MAKSFPDSGPSDEQQREEVVNLLGQFLSDIKEGKIKPLMIEHIRKTTGVPDRGMLVQCLTGIENLSVDFVRLTTPQENN